MRSYFPAGAHAGVAQSASRTHRHPNAGVVMSESPEGLSFRLLVLKTRQVEAVRAFYKAVGIAFAPERHGQGPAHYAGKVGSATLEVYPLAEGATADHTTRLGFTVRDLTTALDSLRAVGAIATGQPKVTPWGVRAVVHDPDGRAVEIYQPDPEANRD